MMIDLIVYMQLLTDEHWSIKTDCSSALYSEVMKRGNYRLYHKTPSVDVPKVSAWRRKKELEKTILEESRTTIEPGKKIWLEATQKRSSCTYVVNILYSAM